jgi:acetyl-CoA C-acetyltransferase
VTALDPRTPIVVGVGQSSELLDSPDYRRRSPVDLAADAAREALADAGADADAIDTVAGTRQFENSMPGARAPLGRSNNYPRSVAGRLGAQPKRAVLEVAGGQSPQHLVNEFAATIAAGDAEVVLIVGSEAISTIEKYAKADDKPDFTEHVDGDLEDRGYGLKGLVDMHQAQHGLTDAPSQYALLENARRARLKLSREEYAAAIGRLFAPFTRVAAANPARLRADRAHRRGTGYPDRDEPGHRRALHPVRGRPGEGQPGRRRVAHLGRRRRAAGHPGGEMGIPGRARRPTRA